MSALDELASYLGDPDRPYDARALELLAAALEERRAGMPAAGYMGRDLDLPWQPGAGGEVELSDAVIAGGWVVSAGAVPVPDAGPMPLLLFRFARYDGELTRPIALIMSEEQTRKAGPLVKSAAGAAIRAARQLPT